ncbi:hypothetical protein NBRC116494_22040 [Aurantivibrio plasticivorans]
MMNSAQFYQRLCDSAREALDHFPGREPSAPLLIQQVMLGLSWSYARIASSDSNISHDNQLNASTGICFSPLDPPRTLPWAGSLVGRSVEEIIPWVTQWDRCAATVGVAVCNAIINHSENELLSRAQSIHCGSDPHLSVFQHFSDQLTHAKVAIIGRYPGLDQFASSFDFTCIEKRPGPDDLPESAAEFVLPTCDWVFITASSIANKTLPRLLALSQHATVVLLGPSLPWLADWSSLGVNYLAGVRVNDPQALSAVVSEGGGTRLFDEAVRYHLLAL